MKANRIFNFNPGPAALSLEVLEEAQASFFNYGGSGMSVLEISHRSKQFEEIVSQATARVKRLLNMDDRFTVLFLQGGASLQFAMAPMNFLSSGKSADYVDTGTWSQKAIKEAKKVVSDAQIRVPASSADRNYAYIPENIDFNPDAAYVHITSNNTIKGTQWQTFPDTGGVPLISDMSSDILSRPIDVEKFGLIYAGAQKNLGPAGVCMVIIRDDMVEAADDTLPAILQYKTLAPKNSLYNTAPCFTIYMVGLMLKWLEDLGGVEKMQEINDQKASRLYECIDTNDFYTGTADTAARSAMNVTFRLPSETLEQQFVAEALAEGLGGLKGHRSVGGCRASIYNSISMDAVTALIDFMKNFAQKNG